MSGFFRTFWPYVHRYRWIIALAYLASLLATLITLSIGLFINARLDMVLADPDLIQTLGEFISIIVVFIVVSAVLNFTRIYAMAWAGARYIHDLRRDVFAKILNRGELLIDDESSGELQTRVIADTTALDKFLSVTLPSLFTTAISLVGSVAGVLYINTTLALLCGLGAIVLCIPLVLFINPLRKRGEHIQAAMALAGRQAGEAFRNSSMVHAFNQSGRERARFKDSSDDIATHSLAAVRLQTLISTVVNTCMFILLVMIIWFGALQIERDEASIGELVSFAYFAILLISSGIGLVEIVTGLGVAVGNTRKIVDILNVPNDPLHEGARSISSAVRIEFLDVSYQYPTRNMEALSHVNLSLEPGQRIAFVGTSGSGKSTFFKLLLRLHEPTSGKIVGDGIDASEYSLKSWRTQFGFVPQTEYLISGSVSENIGYGKTDPTREEIEAAAMSANAHEFITELPDSYETDLGEVGSRLSGGQKQRISLARAILVKPRIYLLDEATSSLDAESEQAVESALDRLAATSTLLIIAHRLHTVRHADRIVVLDAGCIVAEGTHEELHASQPVYQKLISAYRQ